jgi:hypothetical protein
MSTMMNEGRITHWLLAALALVATPVSLSAQATADPPGLGSRREASTSLRAGRPSLAVHETTKGVFIDPLITEHAFVDRKVRWDFAARLLSDDEGELYQNSLIFEYAFTDWFALELDQPFLAANPSDGESASGLGDLSLAAKFQLTKAASTGGLILATGLEFSLPSGQEKVGAGEEYVVAPLAALDWAIGSGLFKLQSQAEFEFVFPRGGGDGELEAIEWNTAVSIFPSDYVVPLLEFNTEFEGLQEDETESILALTPGVVVSLKDIAGKSFDIAAGAQIFFGSGREEDVAFLVSLRHHWSVQNGLGGLAGTDHP